MSGLIYLTEDDPEMGRVVVASLEREGFHVRWFVNAQSTLVGFEEAQPEFWLLDLGLPDMDGLTLLQRLRPEFAGAILILSARGFEPQKVRALDAGADDYLVKPFGLGELLARLRVLRRRLPGREPVRQRWSVQDLVIDLDAHTVERDGQPLHLTPIEFTLLATLIQAKGQLLTHRKLLHAVWGADAVDQTHYLRIYMGKLRAKIERIPAEPSILLTETGVGYRIGGGH
jgi:two-component system, OmpR family, KDP operon response regulator KdpE